VKIIVTGPTGNVGKHVVANLVRDGAQVIAAGQSPDRIKDEWGDCVEARHLDFWQPSTWPGALAGATRLFLVRPPAISKVKQTLNPFVDEARARGVEHTVFLSVAGADANRFVPHRAVEDHLRTQRHEHTNLRPGFFAQNLLSAYRDDIVSDDRIFVPAGRRQPVNWIDARDIADVASMILLTPDGHRGKNYTLAGPGAIPWSEVEGILSEVLRRRIRYEPASVLGYIRHRSHAGAKRGEILVQTLLHFLLRFGQGAGENTTVEQLLGRPPRSLRTFVEDHAQRWSRQASAPDGRDPAAG